MSELPSRLVCRQWGPECPAFTGSEACPKPKAHMQSRQCAVGCGQQQQVGCDLAGAPHRQIHTGSQQYQTSFGQRQQTAKSAIWPMRPTHRLTGGQSALERRTVVGTSEVGPDSSRSYTKAVRRGRNISLATFLGRCMMAAQTARPRAVWNCIVCSTQGCLNGRCFWEVTCGLGAADPVSLCAVCVQLT